MNRDHLSFMPQPSTERGNEPLASNSGINDNIAYRRDILGNHYPEIIPIRDNHPRYEHIGTDNYHKNNSPHVNYPRYDPIRGNYPQIDNYPPIPSRENYPLNHTVRDNFPPRYDPIRESFPYHPIPIHENYPQIPFRDNYPHSNPIRDNFSQYNPTSGKYPQNHHPSENYPHPIRRDDPQQLGNNAIDSNTIESRILPSSQNLSQTEIVKSQKSNENSTASNIIAYKSKISSSDNHPITSELSSNEVSAGNSKNLDNTMPSNSIKNDSNEINKEKKCNNSSDDLANLDSKKESNSKKRNATKKKKENDNKKSSNSKDSDLKSNDSNDKKKDNDYFNEALHYANNILKKSLSTRDKSLDTTCDICHKVLAHKACMKAHKRTHTGEKPYPCTVCGKHFSQSSQLTTHLRIHSGERPYVCKCGKNFIKASDLTRHERVHSGERPFGCTDCPKSFSTSGELVRHRRIHTGERPYTCSVCTKTFAQKSILAYHEKTHTGIKPFSCDTCVRGFYCATELNKHNKSRNHFKKLAEKNFIAMNGGPLIKTEELSVLIKEEPLDQSDDVQPSVIDANYFCKMEIKEEQESD